MFPFQQTSTMKSAISPMLRWVQIQLKKKTFQKATKALQKKMQKFHSGLQQFIGVETFVSHPCYDNRHEYK